MSPLKNLIRSTFTYGIGDVLLFGISYLVMIPLLTHYLSPEEYGAVATLNTLSVFLVAALQIGLPSAAFRFWYMQKSRERQRAYMTGIWLTSVVLAAVLVAALLFLGRPLWDRWILRASFDEFAPYIVWGAFCQVLIAFKSVILRALDRSRWFIMLDITQFIVMLTMVWFQVVVLHAGVIGQVKGVFYTQVVFALISAVIVLCTCGIRVSREGVGRSVVFALPVFVTGIVSLMATRSTILIAQNYVSAAAVGILALGMQIGAMVQLAATSFEKAWQPFLYSRDPEHARTSLRAILDLAAPAYTLAAMFLALFAPELIGLASSPAYASAWVIVGIAAFGALFVALSSIVNGGLYYATRSGASLLVTSLAAATNVLLCWLLIPRWGISGAALATTLSGVVSVTFMIVAARKAFDRDLGFYRVFGAIALGLALTGAAMVVSRQTSIAPLLVWIVKYSAIAIYVRVIWKMKWYRAITNALVESHQRTDEVVTTGMLSTK